MAFFRHVHQFIGVILLNNNSNEDLEQSKLYSSDSRVLPQSTGHDLAVAERLFRVGHGYKNVWEKGEMEGKPKESIGETPASPS